ncbi:MAG TPA: nitroreductase/quinone reductase family protein [Candidatus Limnocylindria bacterium]|nr:nitroreductase/quinone reductase family protein [Candidatus Limnocylindria bacterium]
MQQFPKEVLDAVANEKEVRLTTYGRKTGKESSVTIWIVTDGDKVFIRSGQGLTRHWPKNLLARPEGKLRVGKRVVPFKSRHINDPAEARHSSRLYGPKYGSHVKPSREGDSLTPGEQAAFELLPADDSL